LHRAAWKLLGQYESWITTARKPADNNTVGGNLHAQNDSGPAHVDNNRAGRTPSCGLLLWSAKGAARATKLDQELIAPRSALREFLRSTAGERGLLTGRKNWCRSLPLRRELPRSSFS